MKLWDIVAVEALLQERTAATKQYPAFIYNSNEN